MQLNPVMLILKGPIKINAKKKKKFKGPDVFVLKRFSLQNIFT